MKYLFFLLLIPVIALIINSCANSKEDTSGAIAQMDQTLDQPNFKDDEVNPNIPNVTIDTCYLIDNTNIDNSTIDNSTITDNSSIKNSTVKNCSTVTRSTVDNSSTIENSSISDSTVNKSSICVKSKIDNASIDNATVCNSSTVQGGSAIFSSTVDNSSTVQGGSTVRNSSTVCNNSTVDNVTIDNATVCNSTVSNVLIANVTMLESVAPTVSGGVTISGASGVQNNLLNTGDVVSVTATFSENVSVNGTPQLTLLVGTTDRTATYTSGSGGTTLVFQYTIQAGETDSDGISIGADVIALNSGTISDASGNNANLAHSSVPKNSSFMVDTTAPTVTSFTSTSADGTYTDKSVPNNVNITATASEGVVSGNTITVTLDTGDNVTLTAAANGTTLVGTYTIGSGDSSIGRLNVSSFSIGTVTDSAGNAMTSTTLPATNINIGSNIVIGSG